MHGTDRTNSRLVETISGLRIHDHLALMCSSKEAYLAVLVPYLRNALQRNERCLHVTRSDLEDAALQELFTIPDLAEARSRGIFHVATPGDFQPADQPFDFAFFLRYLKDRIAEAKKLGFSALRVSEERTWAHQCDASVPQLMEFESHLNDFVLEHDVAVLCLYNMPRFSADTLLEVIQTHPLVIFNDVPLHNYNYLPPQHFLGPQRLDRQVEQLLKGMTRSEEMHQEIRMQRPLLKALYENTSDAVFIKDLEGRYLMMNSAGAAVFGTTPEKMVGRKDSEVLSPEESEILAEVRRRALRSQKPITVEVSFTVGGTTRTFLTTEGPFTDEAGTIIGIYGIARDITERKRREGETLAAQESLRSLAVDRCLVEEQERRRIAAALHDQIGQTLALAKIKLALLERGQQDGTLEELRQISDLLTEAINHTRSLTVELSPPALYELGLHAALSGFFDDFERTHGLKILYHHSKGTVSLPEELRVVLYQGVRELMMNIARHAQATQVQVIICEVPNHVKVVITDNGVGFTHSRTAGTRAKSFGLFNLRERLKVYGGELSINSTPGSGTSVTISVALRQNPVG